MKARWVAAILVTAVVPFLALPGSSAAFTTSSSQPGTWSTRSAFSAPVVDLGTAGGYSVLAYTGIANTGATVLGGDLGLSPGSTVSGFPPGHVVGATHLTDAPAAQAQVDLVSAYDSLTPRPATTALAGDQIGVTLGPGVYSMAGAFALTGVLTFDARGETNAQFIIKVDAALNTAAGSRMVLVNGARASQITYQVNGAAGLGALSTFTGTVLAVGAITAGAGSSVEGRLLSRGVVTLAGNSVVRPT